MTKSVIFTAEVVILTALIVINPSLIVTNPAATIISLAYIGATITAEPFTVTEVTTTRGNRDNNCDWSDRICHASHSYCHEVTGIAER